MKVAFATCAALPDGWSDGHPVAALVGAEYRVWDDETVDWAAYDRVVLRSVWDTPIGSMSSLGGAPLSAQTGCVTRPRW
jgi:hypothetical protein